jgi:hypothetical protein
VLLLWWGDLWVCVRLGDASAGTCKPTHWAVQGAVGLGWCALNLHCLLSSPAAFISTTTPGTAPGPLLPPPPPPPPAPPLVPQAPRCRPQSTACRHLRWAPAISLRSGKWAQSATTFSQVCVHRCRLGVDLSSFDLDLREEGQPAHWCSQQVHSGFQEVLMTLGGNAQWGSRDCQRDAQL